MRPWEADCGEHYAEVLEGDRAILRADAPCTGEDRGNVQLAAAAPELLAALEEALTLMGYQDAGMRLSPEDIRPVWDLARAAVAKAFLSTAS